MATWEEINHEWEDCGLWMTYERFPSTEAIEFWEPYDRTEITNAFTILMRRIEGDQVPDDEETYITGILKKCRKDAEKRDAILRRQQELEAEKAELAAKNAARFQSLRELNEKLKHETPAQRWQRHQHEKNQAERERRNHEETKI